MNLYEWLEGCSRKLDFLMGICLHIQERNTSKISEYCEISKDFQRLFFPADSRENDKELSQILPFKDAIS
jgi:hypothetical protein